MRTRRVGWEWLIALILGFGLGLAYAWVFSPVKYVDAEPMALRDNFKDHFRSAIAAAFASNGDLERARARLSLLGAIRLSNHEHVIGPVVDAQGIRGHVGILDRINHPAIDQSERNSEGKCDESG